MDVTPGAKLKASFHGWRADDRAFFVSTNERDPQYFDMYEVAVADYAKTLLYRNTDGYALGAISRDERYLALVKPRTTSDADIFCTTGPATRRRTSRRTRETSGMRQRISHRMAAGCSFCRMKAGSIRRFAP